MEKRACELRQARIKRKPFKLREFRGVNQASVKKLEAAGIKDVEQMLAAGKTPQSRQALAEKTACTLGRYFGVGQAIQTLPAYLD